MANITPLPEDPQYRFQPATQAWFASAFMQATPAQQAAWSAIGAGDCTLVIAPTGSGKTLAAFLHAIDRLFRERENEPADTRHTTTRVLYISPIKALGADVRRNLRLPLDGVSDIRRRRGDAAVTLTVGMRTPAAERAVLQRRPPDILITTPESLYLMLTAKARETLRGVTTVIIDEIHAVAGTKRGAHLAFSLERLDALLPAPAQRIGLSATVRPVERVADFLGGRAAGDGGQSGVKPDAGGHDCGAGGGYDRHSGARRAGAGIASRRPRRIDLAACGSRYS